MRLRSDFLYNAFKEAIIQIIRFFRSIEDCLINLPKCVHNIIHHFILCQSAPLPTELRQFGTDGIHTDGAGIGVQQAVSPQGADFMAFFRCFCDSTVNRQHLRIVLLQNGI